jgi:nucleotide-binding universal stress UspA family protein
MPSFEKIVAATDMSESSNRALQLAATLAHSVGAELHLCFVNESASAVGLFPSFRRGRSLHTGALEQQLRGLSAKIEDSALEPTTAVVSAPHAANGILEYAEDVESDLIVMGSRGQGIWRRAFLGSVALETVENARCSVLVVPAHDKPAEAETVSARGPVLAVLDADGAGRVFNQARLLARSLSTRLELACVAPGRAPGDSESVAKKGWLEELEEGIGGAMKLDSAQIGILDGTDGDQLVAIARRLMASVIVLSRQPGGRSDEEPRKNLADRKGLVRSVLSKAFCPVLVVG